MSPTIPTSYDTEDLTVGLGMESGQLIKPAPLQVLANNHNFIGGNYRPPVGEVFYHSGFTTSRTAGSWRNLCGISVPREKDGRGLLFSGVFANSSAYSAEVRLAVDSNTGSAVTITAGTSAQTVTLSCSSPSSAAFVATVQANTGYSETNNETLQLLCGSFYWDDYTGTQSDSPTNGGFLWAQTSEFASNYPLNVEQVNRLLGGPLTSWKSKPQAIGGVHWGWTYRFPSTTSTTYQDLGTVVLHKRRDRCKVKFYALGVNATIRATFPTGSIELTTATTGGPDPTFSPSAITVNESGEVDLYGLPSPMVVGLSWRSTTGSAAEIMDLNFLLDKD